MHSAAMWERFRKQLLHLFRRSDNVGPVALAIVIGLAGGAAAIVFRYLIVGADWLFFQGGARALPFLSDAYVIALPVLGLVLVSMMVRRFAPEAAGHGVPEVMYAVKKQGGRIRPRVVLLKALASALCIGSGGSVGREGPIVQIGSSVGSTIGQFLGLRERRVRLLVACGAAAGIAGTFNAPIAGVLFALEVILGDFAARSFGLVVLSSVTSTAVCQAVLGAEPAFPLTRIFALVSYWELPIYLGLGLVAGMVSLCYVQVLTWLEDLFARWRWHYAIKAAAGGLAVGLVGYIGVRFLGGRYLFGVGYDGIEAVLKLDVPVGLDWGVGVGLTVTALLMLCGLKILATSMTLASGGSGGVFAPALFIGAMLGGAYGMLVGELFPGVTAAPGAYAIVGMGAVFAGSAHAPITSVLILFEMTKDYKIILPLMIAVVISHLIASHLKQDSVYTVKLRRRGGLTPPPGHHSVLDLVLVADAMSTEVQCVEPGESVVSLAIQFHGGGPSSYPVVDRGRDELLGIVSRRDVESALVAGPADDRTAADIMTRNLFTCTPDQPLREVMATITRQDVEQMLVVDKDRAGKLLGILRRSSLLWAYGELVSEHSRLLSEAGVDLGAGGESVQLSLEVSARDRGIAFKRIREIRVPERCLIVMLRRAGKALVPRGDTVVEPGDALTLLCTPEAEAGVRRWMEQLSA
ncbi:MAG: chloride channel protein [Deltaproteobacteria bacterium]|nr:chloride channel protein [Deltaproteobacteria bacterium]